MMQSAHTATAGLDTIAAIATPPGTAGLSVIRLSGDRAVELAAAVFTGADLTEVETHTVHYGRLEDADGRFVDEVMATVFRAPRSYTGEDSVEFSCHGGTVVTQGVLESVLARGVRHAEPGEFTRRAFLNGRIDLVQAEAVADLIHAQSRDAHLASLRQLEGVLSTHVRQIREQLVHAASMLELSLDFVEEDVAFMTPGDLQRLIAGARQQLQRALDSFGSGRLIREGVRVALLGRPNVGKSSLMNALLGSDRAIVTDVPGTTRDFIEEAVLLRGELFRFIDTAGLRATSDTVEREGIARTHAIARQADVVCLLSEAAEGKAGHGALDILTQFERSDQQVLRLYTKCDLIDEVECAALSNDGVPVSVRDLTRLEPLRDALVVIAQGMRAPSELGSVMVTNTRHAECLRKSLEGLRRAEAALVEGRTEEFVALDVREAIDALGEMIGEVTSDDVLNGIFARFCIGK
ncbi:MAG: tRNA uridine-5-carboxymethylaminomethyl(34) synthesis GTPase MnmE [Bacteroidetes bacterium]|nr:tRNA uridine-5-carboxymethylaminomethyl(34) synthesis GTPase MnmE [Bacteroidota bacterium]